MLIQDISVRKINLWSLEDWMMDEKSTLLGLFLTMPQFAEHLEN